MDRPKMRNLKPGEEGAFLDLMSAAFGFRDVFARYFEFDERLRVEDTKVLCDGQRMLAGLQIFTRRIRLRGELVLLGGIGSVATHPEYENLGFATRLLRSAITEMTARGMLLSLLFTERPSFYERLGWVRIPYFVWLCAAPHSASVRMSRPAARKDLVAIRELYARYNRGMDCTTWRDPVYWRGQLRFAGTPDEDFRVVEKDGLVAAYARSIALAVPNSSEPTRLVMEYAREEDAAGELVQLLAEMTPNAKPAFVIATSDSLLKQACRDRFSDCRTVEFPDRMWRILDSGRLRTLLGSSVDVSDGELLEQLVAAEGSVFWPSDRF